MPTILFFPPGITVNIIGMNCSSHDRSCYYPRICGSLIAEDVVVCFWIPCFRLDRLLLFVFFKSELTRFSDLYEGVLGQINSMGPGRSVAVIISCLPEFTIKQITINKTDDTNSDESFRKKTWLWNKIYVNNRMIKHFTSCS